MKRARSYTGIPTDNSQAVKPSFLQEKPGKASLALLIFSLAVLPACKDDHARALESLQKHGVQPTATAVHEQARLGRTEVVSLLIKAGAPAAEPDATGLTPAMKAARAGEWPILDALLPGLSISALNQPDPDGQPVLHYALAADQLETVNHLLDAGAATAALTEKGAPAVEAAINGGKLPLARRLIDGLGDSRAARQRALFAAIKAGSKDLVSHCLSRGADAAAVVKGESPLSLAAASGAATDLLRLLIESGATPQQAPGLLKNFAASGDRDMVSYLLDTGAPVDIKDADGSSALTSAIQKGSRDIAVMLLQRGADASALTEQAITAPTPELLTFLLDNGLSAQARDGAGEPLLVRAVLGGQPENIKLLLARGADPVVPGTDGQSPLHIAAASGSTPVVETLIQQGADPNAPFASPVTPAFLARIKNEHFEGWLKKDTGLTPLMLAASRGDTDMVALLLNKGAKRGQQTKGWKRYPVQFACDTANIRAAQQLLGRNIHTDNRDVKVTIYLSRQRATLYKNGEVVRGSTVSTGRKGNRTPTGKYVITDKQASWISSIYKVPMPFFMRLSCKEIGMHQGVCPGYPASHGCIRMPAGEVRAFFAAMQIGDQVDIVD